MTGALTVGSARELLPHQLCGSGSACTAHDNKHQTSDPAAWYQTVARPRPS